MITSSDVRDEIQRYLDNCGEKVNRQKLNDMTDVFIERFGRKSIDSVPDAAWSEFLQDQLS